MSLLNRSFRIAVALFLLGSPVSASDIPQELQTVILEGNLYGRSSVDFRPSAKNVTSLIPEGTKGTVLETRKLSRTGSYGVKVRIDSVSKNMGSTTAKANDEVWVYYSQKEPWLSFQDKAGEDVQDPENALTAKAKRDGQGLPAEGTVSNPALPTKKDVKRFEAEREKDLAAAEAKRKANALKNDPNLAAPGDKTKTEAGFTATCENCTDTVADKNVRDISAVARETEKAAPVDPNNPWADDPYVSAYSSSKKVEGLIKTAKKGKASRSLKLCYRYVKRALMNSDVIDDYPPSGKAKLAVSDLKSQGMVNLLDNPKYAAKIKTPADAPKGAVLVYSTGESKEAGHIEIKTGEGDKATYISDYESKNNIQLSPKGLYKAKVGKPYKIIGVMILPPEKL